MEETKEKKGGREKREGEIGGNRSDKLFQYNAKIDEKYISFNVFVEEIIFDLFSHVGCSS